MSQEPDDPHSDRTDVWDRFLPSPELRAAFDATDRLMEGLTREEKLQFAREMYHDADGMPQWRRARIRALPPDETEGTDH